MKSLDKELAAATERAESALPARLKRMARIVDEAEAIEEESAEDAGALMFTARLLTQVSLPHSMRKGNEYSRRSGRFQMHVLSPSAIGLPFGHYPRLLLTWITT